MSDPSINHSPFLQNGQHPSSQSQPHDRFPKQNPQENQANQHDESCSSDDQIVCVFCQKQIKRSKIYKHLKKHKNKPRKQPHRGVDTFWGWGTYAQKSKGRPKGSMNVKESGQKSSQNKIARKKISKKKGALQLQRLGQRQMSVKGRQVGKYQLKRRKFNNLDYKKYLQPQKSLIKRQQESQSSQQDEQSQYEEYKPASSENQIQIQNQSLVQNDNNQGSENMQENMIDEQLSVQQIFKKVKKTKKIKKMKVQQQKEIKHEQNNDEELRNQIQEQKNDHKQRKYKKNNLKNTYPKITSFVRSEELTERNKQYVSTLEKQVIKLRKQNKQSQLQVQNLNKKIKILTDYIQANLSVQEKNNNEEKTQKKQQDLMNKINQNLNEEKKMSSDEKIKFEKDKYKIQDSPTKKNNPKIIQKKQKLSKSDNSKKNEPIKQNKLKQMKIDVDWFKKDVTKNNQKNIVGSNKTNAEISSNMQNIEKISISDFNMEEEQSKKQKYQTLD